MSEPSDDPRGTRAVGYITQCSDEFCHNWSPIGYKEWSCYLHREECGGIEPGRVVTKLDELGELSGLSAALKLRVWELEAQVEALRREMRKMSKRILELGGEEEGE
jgi:hypothetical protein